MSYTVITPGFTGYLLPTGSAKPLRFATCGINAVQEVEAPDMVMGDYTHNAWAYGKIEVGGQVSGPMDEYAIDTIYDVWNGDPATMNFVVRYYSGYMRTYKHIAANSLTINVNAGEIVNFTLDVIGTDMDITTANDAAARSYTSKLLTWDKASMYMGTRTGTAVSGGNLIEGLQSFTITITNNITRQFAIKASDLYGRLVRGMSAVTGQMVSYTQKGSEDMSGVGTGYTGAGVLHWNMYNNNDYYPIEFRLGSKKIACTVVFHRATSELSTGPVLTTLGFTGIGHFGGENPLATVSKVIDVIP